MEKYDHKKIEAKWQNKWEEAGVFRAQDFDKKRKKYYSLETFPYPSAAGLHVGHPKGYIGEDINARYRRRQGLNVMYTMGWDAFGLPTENYAIKIGKNPKAVAEENIQNFRRQVKMFGLSYDWEREINTSSPEYYKWTQWIFLQFFKRGLTYRGRAPVNWCEHCKTVLANEQVKEGVCERCENPVAQRVLEQWFFRITKYAEELLQGLEGLDWTESTKEAQRNWIGRSDGTLLSFDVIARRKTTKQFPGIVNRSPRAFGARDDVVGRIEVFTTRPDTLYGATYMVLAPEHELISNLKSQISNLKEVESYIAKAKLKTQLERMATEKEKTGVELKGVQAINPATKEEIPIWVADYVLVSYGTGAIMAVPAYDERDREFAEKFKLPIVDRPLKDKDEIIKKFGGKKVVQYKLRDWLVSRQRYWGCPIPIIWCAKCGAVPVPEKDLPVRLPDDVDFRPTGEPPLASSKLFQQVPCPGCGGEARRDYETMDTFVDSAWYFFRYCDPQNDRAPFDTKRVHYWMPVDLYIIGAEHTALHLLYARFFTKAFRDLGLIKFGEPFLKLRHQGLILGEDNRKMSKRRGNVVNPDEVVEKYGADALRLYEMFMGPFEEGGPWSTKSLIGVRRFLDRVWNLQEKVTPQASSRAQRSGVEETHTLSQARGEIASASPSNDKIDRILHKTVKKVTEDIEQMKFNTAIAALMTLVNEMSKQQNLQLTTYNLQLKLLNPFAPHITEELWEKINSEFRIQNLELLCEQPWPQYDPALVKDEEIELVIQVNGQVRERLRVDADIDEETAKRVALTSEKVKKWVEGKEIKDVIFVKGRLINVVTSEIRIKQGKD